MTTLPSELLDKLHLCMEDQLLTIVSRAKSTVDTYIQSQITPKEEQLKEVEAMLRSKKDALSADQALWESKRLEYEDANRNIELQRSVYDGLLAALAQKEEEYQRLMEEYRTDRNELTFQQNQHGVEVDALEQEREVLHQEQSRFREEMKSCQELQKELEEAQSKTRELQDALTAIQSLVCPSCQSKEEKILTLTSRVDELTASLTVATSQRACPDCSIHRDRISALEQEVQEGKESCTRAIQTDRLALDREREAFERERAAVMKTKMDIEKYIASMRQPAPGSIRKR